MEEANDGEANDGEAPPVVDHLEEDLVDQEGDQGGQGEEEEDQVVAAKSSLG